MHFLRVSSLVLQTTTRLTPLQPTVINNHYRKLNKLNQSYQYARNHKQKSLNISEIVAVSEITVLHISKSLLFTCLYSSSSIAQVNQLGAKFELT